MHDYFWLDLLDYLSGHQPVPDGRRMAVVGNPVAVQGMDLCAQHSRLLGRTQRVAMEGWMAHMDLGQSRRWHCPAQYDDTNPCCRMEMGRMAQFSERHAIPAGCVLPH